VPADPSFGLDTHERSYYFIDMSKGGETRGRILDEALTEASRVGLEGLSIGGLAKVAGMSKSGLFAHFESKEELQLEVLETARVRFIDWVVVPALRQPRGEPRVRALFQGWVDWEERRSGGCPFVAASPELDDRPGRLRDSLVAVQKEWIETLATAVKLAVAEGHFRSDLDPHQLAYDIYGVFMAFHTYHRLLRAPEARDRAQAAFDALLDSAR